MKYQQQLASVKPAVDAAKNVLVVLPAQSNTDLLAAGLSLFLALKQNGKDASIVTESPLLVGNSNLFGVGEIKNTFPQTKGGDMILTLGDLVMPDGSVPALEKLDWYPEGADLNLVFHVVPGQRLEPSRVETKHTSGSFDLIITVGVTSLTEAGNIYVANQSAFANEKIFNIDNNPMNQSFGQHRLLDSTSPSHSQIIAQVMPDLGLNMDADIATNILAGIYEATQNLTQGVGADTFMVVGMAMQQGGKAPMAQATPQPVAQPVQQAMPVQQTPMPQPMMPQAPIAQPQPVQMPQAPYVAPQVTPMNSPMIDQSALNQNFDLKMFQTPNLNPVVSPEPVSPIPGPAPVAQPQPEVVQPVQQQPAPQQPQVMGEKEVMPSTPVEQTYEDDSFNPQPDWLTPKVFKSGGGVE